MTASDRLRRLAAGVAAGLLAMLAAAGAAAQALDPERLLAAVVRVEAEIPGDAQSARTLGTDRTGTGVAIDGDGLIVTIGYTVMEAASITVTTQTGRRHPAELVAYDQASGFGLLRAGFGFDAPPLPLGDSAAAGEGTPVLVLSRGGAHAAMPAMVVSRREFAGYWEYLLDNAIFTAPPHPAFNGAALVDGSGRLVGIGSLIVGEAVPGRAVPGNMFVPVSELTPILGDLLAFGQRQDPPRPWLGVSLREERDWLLVERVTANGPAHAAGLRAGDRIVGIGGRSAGKLAGFYRTLWDLGPAGVAVPLTVLRGTAVVPLTVESADRLRHMRLRPTY
ncbi:S1C family serine protease [Azospirillum halopraeferens]|uniref:S1C family serine protease n=1 Tax=Azospirillum halopraeferens TaxID=34010 RepID=UPI0003FE5C5D|nr:S1C family serine protease [Azospirillum halopraeferens]